MKSWSPAAEWTALYRVRVRLLARLLKSDGCTGVPEFYRDACFEHDYHYRTHLTLSGRVITRAQADWLFGQRIRLMARQNLSWHPATWRNLLGYPLSITRWLGVRLFGASSWAHQPMEPPSPTTPQSG